MVTVAWVKVEGGPNGMALSHKAGLSALVCAALVKQ